MEQVKGFANAKVALPIRAAAEVLAVDYRAPMSPLAALPSCPPNETVRIRPNGEPVAPA